MAKRVKEEALGGRTSRLRLDARHKPYFRVVEEGIHLGYRRSMVDGHAGTWLARRYLGDGRYETESLGPADDLPTAPEGVVPFTYDQAARAAREWGRQRAVAARVAASAAGTITVRNAVANYIASRKTRSLRTGRDAELRLGHHVLAAPLADVALAALTDEHLAQWRDGLRRGGRGVKDDAPPLANATLARLLNDFRAALTHAGRKARLPADVLMTIREGLRAPEAPDRAREKQHVSDTDVLRIVEAAYAQDADFGALVLVLAATGCRFDQAARLTVADLQISNRRIMVPTSKKGRGTKAQTHITIPLPDYVLARLRSLIAGRRGQERLLLRWHHKQVEGDKATGRLPEWERTERRPWSVASEMTRPWRAALTQAELAIDLVPYCLRHSSIIRGLQVNLPARLVAAVHDTSTAMIDKHYSAFITDASQPILRLASLTFAPPATAELHSLAAERTKKRGTANAAGQQTN